MQMRNLIKEKIAPTVCRRSVCGVELGYQLRDIGHERL